MLDSIGHVARVVKDPARTASLFKELFGSKVVSRADEDGHQETFVGLVEPGSYFPVPTWNVRARAITSPFAFRNPRCWSAPKSSNG